QSQEGFLRVAEVVSFLDLCKVLSRPLCSRLRPLTFPEQLVALVGVFGVREYVVLPAALDLGQPPLEASEVPFRLVERLLGDAQIGGHTLGDALPGRVEVDVVLEQVAEKG